MPVPNIYMRHWQRWGVKLDVKPKERSVIKTEPGKGKTGRVNNSEFSMRLRDWYLLEHPKDG
jgi:hypothetical protein